MQSPPDSADQPAPAPTPAQLAWAEARAARLDRWRRPLVSRWDRLRAWTNMLLVDHGVFRLVYLNLHAVGARAWRASQPAPHQIRAFARAGGRHVVTLRGGQSFGSLPLEIEACARAGLSFHTLVLRSRALPSAAEVHKAAALFAQFDGPVLFHCKSGADRAGFVAALWLMLAEGRPVAEAQAQLSWRYGHIRQGKTGVLDTFFDAYARDTADTPMALMDWVDTRYDPAALTAAFRPTGLGRLLSDWLLARE